MATSPPLPHPDASALRKKSRRDDMVYESLQLAKLFALAYAPCIAGFLSLTSAVAILLIFGWDCVCMHLWGSPQARDNVLLVTAACIPTMCLLYVKLRTPPCYLVDFASFKSLDEYKLSTEYCVHLTKTCGQFTVENMLFQLKVLLKSGLGNETYGAPVIFRDDKTPTLTAARGEMDLMMFGALDELLLKTGLSSDRIDFLIVNVSMFYPAPSLSSHLVNHYKMRHDVKTFNISGMGCAAGMVAVDLAKDILRVHKNKYVVIVGTENITLNWYNGNDKSMLVPNCLFRCGSYALLMSNKSVDRQRSKFQLVQSVRTTTGASDTSYNVIVTREDHDGLVGTSLSMKLIDVASQAITISMTRLVPYNMPFSELLKVMVNVVQRTVFKKDMKPYMPDFKKAFNHFCLHPGGKAVIDGVGKSLHLSDYDMEPARMALHRFGNTSSSGLWYAMAYCEAKERLKKGDKVWQVALGSGFKCNSVVWKVLRDVKPQRGFNPWMECIDNYPVEITDKITPSHKNYSLLKLCEDEANLYEENLRRKAEEECRGKQQAQN
ncbi:hypothetical protein GOP47_0008866 [Adiantum capillus-veneris]|uniref:3-ketoacyl-CoA synthase n=1 Tax=Adiantum capillus-veneris TaxID=13818 RepID=A0A9D4UZ53_ADICA|nr:hypothetical protein GOP47_0008866 [Adiantum capillus-veneris]